MYFLSSIITPPETLKLTKKKTSLSKSSSGYQWSVGIINMSSFSNERRRDFFPQDSWSSEKAPGTRPSCVSHLFFLISLSVDPIPKKIYLAIRACRQYFTEYKYNLYFTGTTYTRLSQSTRFCGSCIKTELIIVITRLGNPPLYSYFLTRPIPVQGEREFLSFFIHTHTHRERERENICICISGQSGGRLRSRYKPPSSASDGLLRKV